MRKLFSATRGLVAVLFLAFIAALALPAFTSAPSEHPEAAEPAAGPPFAWTSSTVLGFTIATETITLPTGATTTVCSSSITFIPASRNFVVVANTGAVNTTADGDIDVQVSYNATVWSTLKADLLASFDNAIVSAHYVTGTNGSAPYYRLCATNDGNQGGESLGLAVIVQNQ